MNYNYVGIFRADIAQAQTQIFEPVPVQGKKNPSACPSGCCIGSSGALFAFYNIPFWMFAFGTSIVNGFRSIVFFFPELVLARIFVFVPVLYRP